MRGMEVTIVLGWGGVEWMSTHSFITVQSKPSQGFTSSHFSIWWEAPPSYGRRTLLSSIA